MAAENRAGDARSKNEGLGSVKSVPKLLAGYTVSITVKAINVVTYDTNRASDIFWSVASPSCAINITRVWDAA